MNRFTGPSAFVLLTLGLAACAGPDTSQMNAGERITERGGEITQYGDDWTSGNKEVRDGEKLIARSTSQITNARKKLAKAEADQVKARQMIADGTIKMQRSEADYAAVRAGPVATKISQPE